MKNNSLKYRWFIILQIGFTIFNIILFFISTGVFKDIPILFDTWINFTWKNVALYSTANISVKYINEKHPEKPNPHVPVEEKIKSRKYKIFKYLQIFATLIILTQVFEYRDNFEHVIELVTMWSEFTWVNVGVFFFGNIGSKYSYYQNSKTN